MKQYITHRWTKDDVGFDVLRSDLSLSVISRVQKFRLEGGRLEEEHEAILMHKLTEENRALKERIRSACLDSLMNLTIGYEAYRAVQQILEALENEKPK